MLDPSWAVAQVLWPCHRHSRQRDASLERNGFASEITKRSQCSSLGNGCRVSCRYGRLRLGNTSVNPGVTSAGTGWRCESRHAGDPSSHGHASPPAIIGLAMALEVGPDAFGGALAALLRPTVSKNSNARVGPSWFSIANLELHASQAGFGTHSGSMFRE